MASTKELIEQAATQIIDEIPAFERLKLIVRVDLKGRGDEQIWRLELPGPTATKDPAADAKVEVSMLRKHFNELAEIGEVSKWHEAIDNGQVRASGLEQLLRLIANVVERHEERAKLKRRRV